MDITRTRLGAMPQHPSLDAAEQAVRYLKSCGIRVPDYEQALSDKLIGGSMVEYSPLRLTMGKYPSAFIRNWFAMHEAGHLLWAKHHPLHRVRFRRYFGDPSPSNYNAVHKKESWKTVGALKLSWKVGPYRPSGQPSHYGTHAGGEERFCELIALMYAHGDFSKEPPSDLAELWDVCWSDGLSRMV